MAPSIIGNVLRHSTRNNRPNVTTSQKIWLGKVATFIWGSPACPSGTAVPSVVSREAAIAVLGEENDERHHHAQKAGEFAQSEADQEIGELALRRAGIAQRAGEVIAEDDADADARADERDRGEAGAEIACRFNVHSP